MQKREKKKKLIDAMDIIINDWINSRKSNTFNAFALPISDGNVPIKKFKPVIYRRDAILIYKN